MSRVMKSMEVVLFYFTGLLFLLLFLVNVFQIILRSITDTSLLWVVDFSQLSMVWIVFLGTAVALYKNEHLAVDFLKQKVSSKVAYTLDISTRILFLIFMVVVSYTSIGIVKIRMDIDYVSLGWPTGIAYLALPVSGVFLSLFLIQSIGQSIQAIRNDIEYKTHIEEQYNIAES